MHQLTAQLLANVHAVMDHAVHPRTGAIVVTSNASGVPSLYAVADEGGELRPLLAGRGSNPAWHPDGRHLLFMRDETGDESADLLLLDTETGDYQPLTRDRFAYTWPRFAPDGRLAVICNREGTFDPYLGEERGEKREESDGNAPLSSLLSPLSSFRRLAASAWAASSLVWSPEGRWLGFLRQAGADESGNLRCTLHALDTETGAELELGALGGDLFHADWSWQPGDPPRLCVSADHEEWEDGLLVTLAGERTWLKLGDGDATQPMWSPDGRWLAFLLDEGCNRRLRVLEAATGTRHDLSVADGVHRQPRWAPDSRSLTVLFESATRPSDLWRVALDPNDGELRGVATPLTSGLPPGFPEEALTASQPATFPTFDGRTIGGLLFVPREANGAAVVLVHGGPTASYRNGWDNEVQLLASLGYTVLAPNVRGSTGYGKTFRDLGRMDWGGGDLADLGAARDFLQARGFHHIGILGGSYGGYLVLMALARQPERWAAGAALFPIANLVTLYESSRPGDIRPYLVDQIGTPDARPLWFRDRSPVNFVEQVQAPLLLLQGANDIRTPLAEATSMAERLAAAGKPHYLHVYPNEGHGFQHRETREDALNRVLAFFNEYLNRQEL